jgi:hypothetical protein
LLATFTAPLLRSVCKKAMFNSLVSNFRRRMQNTMTPLLESQSNDESNTIPDDHSEPES